MDDNEKVLKPRIINDGKEHSDSVYVSLKANSLLSNVLQALQSKHAQSIDTSTSDSSYIVFKNKRDATIFVGSQEYHLSFSEVDHTVILICRMII